MESQLKGFDFNDMLAKFAVIGEGDFDRINNRLHLAFRGGVFIQEPSINHQGFGKLYDILGISIMLSSDIADFPSLNLLLKILL